MPLKNVWLKCKKHKLHNIFSRKKRLLCRGTAMFHPPGPSEVLPAPPDISLRGNRSRLLPAINPFEQIKTRYLALGLSVPVTLQKECAEACIILYLWSLILLLSLGSFEAPGSRSLEKLLFCSIRKFWSFTDCDKNTSSLTWFRGELAVLG